MEMPTLYPIPIKTKNKPYIVRIWIWITSIRQWKLTVDWNYTLSDGTKIVIPKGFIFDGATIPRLFWSILSPVGLFLIPSLIHDYAYKNDQLLSLSDDGDTILYKPNAGRAFWDRLFLNIANDVIGVAILNFIAWLLLRIFGYIAWNKYRK